jgi:DNA-binding transcriptional LysR family regulator
MLEQAKQKMKGELDIIDGELRIAVSSDLGRNLVAPWLDEFVESYPQVSLKLNISDSPIDFYRDSVDIALRYGSPDDANLYGFKICNTPGVLCATQDYLDNNGTPTHPHDLPAHQGLFYQLNDIVYDVWTFSRGDQDFKIKMSGDRASNDGDMVRRWCAAGKGLAVKSCLDVAGDLLAGNVVNVMPEFRPRTSELWLICPSRQLITPATRLLRDMLKKKCAKILAQLVEEEFLDDSVLS